MELPFCKHLEAALQDERDERHDRPNLVEPGHRACLCDQVDGTSAQLFDETWWPLHHRQAFEDLETEAAELIVSEHALAELPWWLTEATAWRQGVERRENKRTAFSGFGLATSQGNSEGGASVGTLVAGAWST
jgi:hypothetical protein